MAQWVLDLSLAAASLGLGGLRRVAAKAAGGCFVLVKLDTTTFSALSVDVDGVVLWKRDFTLPGGGEPSNLQLAVNGSNVAIATTDQITTDVCYVALLSGSTGSIVWQKQLPFEVQNYDNTALGSGLAVDSSGNVHVAGRLTGSTVNHRLVKLAVADGSVLWAINPLDNTAVATSNVVNAIALTSTGDVVVGFENGSAVGTVLVFSAAAGALVWAKTIAWTNPTDHTFVGVDPSDNVFAGSWNESTQLRLYVIKLDSSGTELWNKDIVVGSGDNIIAGGGIVADATNVFFGCFITDAFATYQRTTVVVMPTSGATAQAISTVNANLAYAGEAESVSVAGGTLYYTGFDRTPAGSLQRTVVSKVDPTALASSSFSPYARLLDPLTVSTGASVVAAATPTFLTNPTVTPTAGTLTDGANTTIVAALYPESAGPPPIIRFAHSLHPSPQFGKARLRYSFPTDSIAPANQFGTPSLDYNLETYATSIAPANRFGSAAAYRYVPGVPRYPAQAVLPSPMFGAATMLAGGDRFASPVLPSPQFGTPLLRMRLAATSIAPAPQFGAATVRSRFAAVSIVPDAHFGAALLVSIGQASSIQPDNRFGAAALVARAALQATSIAPDPRFGAASLAVRHLAQPIVNRPRFGAARLVQLC